MQYLWVIIGSYLVGSIPFSYLVPKYFGGIDIRKHGSGNTGTTNVLRTLGLKIGAIAFVGDFLKGVIPTLLALKVYGEKEALVAAGVSVLAHCYSVWLGFKGGKGIATSVGLLLVLFPKVFFILFIVQFGIILSTKYMSLASISSAFLFPFLVYLKNYSIEAVLFASALAVFIIFKHRSNIVRLLNKTENKLSLKK